MRGAFLRGATCVTISRGSGSSTKKAISFNKRRGKRGKLEIGNHAVAVTRRAGSIVEPRVAARQVCMGKSRDKKKRGGER